MEPRRTGYVSQNDKEKRVSPQLANTIFPIKPMVPPFFNDTKTGKPLECSIYAVSLYSYAKKKMLARVSFDDFCKMADIENCEKHDRMHVILKGISEERLEEMAAAGCADPLEGI